MRNGIFLAISVNKGCHNHQQLQPPSEGELVRTEGAQEGMNTCHLAAIKLQPLPIMNPEEAQDVKNTGYWPYITEVYIKGMTYVGGHLHPPMHRKALNFLTWDIWFSLNYKKKNQQLLIFSLPALCCKICMKLVLPTVPHPQRRSLRVTEMLPLVLKY